MLKAKVCKDEKTVVEASGSVPELLNDIAVLVSSIYNQLGAAGPYPAMAFRTGLTNLVKDEGSPMWRPVEGQSGIIFPKNN